MHKMLMVVRREYHDRVKKPSFWIGTMVFPALMIGLVFLPMLLVDIQEQEQRPIAVVDESGLLFDALEQELAQYELDDGTPEYVLEPVPIDGTAEETRRALERRVHDKELFAILVIGPEIEDDDNFRLYGLNVGNLNITRTLRGALYNAVVALRLDRLDLELQREQLDSLIARVELDTFQLSESGEARKKGFGEAYLGTFVFVLMLYMTLLIFGIVAMRGILEEKTTRIMEVLLGSLTPRQLMTGKILGIGLVGLTQISIYVATAGAARFYLMRQQFEGDLAGIADTFTASTLVYFVIFFLLGYFLFVTLFAAVGAVCNSEQEAQNLQSPLIMCLVIPMVSTLFFVNNPDSTIAVVLSLIPIFTPMLMFMRISILTPPFWQIALSILLTAGTIWLLFGAVAKIFRIGSLMYGKRPSIPEIIRWARS